MAVGRALHPGFAQPPTAAAAPRHLRFNWRAVAPIAAWLVVVLLPAPHGLSTTQWHYFAVFLGAITGVVFESLWTSRPPSA